MPANKPCLPPADVACCNCCVQLSGLPALPQTTVKPSPAPVMCTCCVCQTLLAEPLLAALLLAGPLLARAATALLPLASQHKLVVAVPLLREASRVRLGVLAVSRPLKPQTLVSVRPHTVLHLCGGAATGPTAVAQAGDAAGAPGRGARFSLHHPAPQQQSGQHVCGICDSRPDKAACRAPLVPHSPPSRPSCISAT